MIRNPVINNVTGWTLLPLFIQGQAPCNPIRLEAGSLTVIDSGASVKVEHGKVFFPMCMKDERQAGSGIGKYRVFDAYTEANRDNILEFVEGYGEIYSGFAGGVFLGRFAHLTSFEDSENKDANNYRWSMAKNVDRWVQSCRLFLDTVEINLEDSEVQLAAMRARVDQVSLDYLFNTRTGQVSIHPVRQTTLEQAVNGKLLRFLVDEMECGHTKDEYLALSRLAEVLEVSQAVTLKASAFIKRAKGHHVDGESLSEQAPADVSSEDLQKAIENDPFYRTFCKHSYRLTYELTKNPVKVFNILSTLKRYVQNLEHEALRKHLERLDRHINDLRAFVSELTYSQNMLEKRFGLVLDKSRRLDASFLRKSSEFIHWLPSVLKESLASFIELVLYHYEGNEKYWFTVNGRVRNTTIYLRQAVELIEKYIACLSDDVSGARKYVLTSKMHLWLSEEADERGVGRLKETLTMPRNVYNRMLVLLTDREKASLDLYAWYRQMYNVGDRDWEKISGDSTPPNIESAEGEVMDFAIEVRDRLLRKELWRIIDMRHLYKRHASAIKKARERGMAVQRGTLHLMMARGYDVLPYSNAIKEGVANICRSVDGWNELPDQVRNGFVDDVALRIIKMNVSAMSGISRKTEYLVEADKRLKALLSGTGEERQRESLRASALRKLSTSPVSYGRLDDTLNKILDEV